MPLGMQSGMQRTTLWVTLYTMMRAAVYARWRSLSFFKCIPDRIPHFGDQTCDVVCLLTREVADNQDM